ncbi:cytochrome C oxidase biogenesis Cmc1-like protein [Carex rostrata]
MRSDKRESESEEEASLPLPANCDRLFRALTECHRRSGSDSRRREAQCRHLNRALGECVVMALCADEAEAVRSLCSSAGTSLKRSQCQRAQIGLSSCLSAHQR